MLSVDSVAAPLAFSPTCVLTFFTNFANWLIERWYPRGYPRGYCDRGWDSRPRIIEVEED